MDESLFLWICSQSHHFSCILAAMTSSLGKLVVFQREMKSSRLTIFNVSTAPGSFPSPP